MTTEVIQNLEKHHRVFLTGSAGTGKSFGIKQVQDHFDGRAIAVAPTGLAANNLGGVTIHSFFGLPSLPILTLKDTPLPDARVRKLLRKAEVIIVDEVSMVRADLMDAMDRLLRSATGDSRPFGGKNIIIVGDLYQLPPVLRNEDKQAFGRIYPSVYFFDSKVYQRAPFHVINLTKTYRQTEASLVEALNAVRVGRPSEQHLALFNQRVANADDDALYLTTTNKKAQEINLKGLEKLEGAQVHLKAQSTGKVSFNELPVEDVISLKVNAPIIFVKNDREGRFVNGSRGIVRSISDTELAVELDGVLIRVGRERWQKTGFRLDKAKKIESYVIGEVEQFPIKLAYAVTIHKSQGMTLSRAHLDLGADVFAPGQAYVGLSRIVSLSGLSLERPLRHKDVFADSRIMKFMNVA